MSDKIGKPPLSRITDAALVLKLAQDATTLGAIALGVRLHAIAARLEALGGCPKPDVDVTEKIQAVQDAAFFHIRERVALDHDTTGDSNGQG